METPFNMIICGMTNSGKTYFNKNAGKIFYESL